MTRPANRLHVRTYIEDVVQLCEALEGLRLDGMMLPPAHRSYITEIKLFGKAILRKHAEKRTRKDIYVEKRAP